MVGAEAQAQTAAAPQRVEVTGSSIKRLAGETALPVETISRDDIAKIGVTTAAELLQKLSSNVGGLTDGASISDQSGAQRGFNGANLRGLGVTGTLVLLNGRRISTHGQSGSAVDLNAIPMSAIARVEVLKDGASAIYGTDAMGGVINFITRKDYQGGELNLYALGTQEGGAGKKSISASAGFGDIFKDRFKRLRHRRSAEARRAELQPARFHPGVRPARPPGAAAVQQPLPGQRRPHGRAAQRAERLRRGQPEHGAEGAAAPTAAGSRWCRAARHGA
jgi:outer membrane receptor protein involved in Fe transport